MRKDVLLILAFTIFIYVPSLKSEIFHDAKWIGVPGNELPFNSEFLSVFDLEFDLEICEKDTVSFIYGLNDPRLLNANENIFNLSNPKDSSYVKLKFEGLNSIDIYRVGYHPEDSSEIPFYKFDNSQLSSGNNKVKIKSNSGITTLFINDEKIGETVLNPYGRGGDYFAFPVLSEIAVEFNEGSDSYIDNITIKNFREPNNILAKIKGRQEKSAKLSMPLRSMPELKTVINFTKEKDIDNANMIATARGIYDVYVNGEIVSDDYFYPGSTQYNKTHLYQTFDLKPFLHSGENEIKITLGEGWWSGPSTYSTENWNFFGDRQSFICRINVEYKDGNEDIFITSPDSWYYSADGSILEASFFNGEVVNNSKRGMKQTWKPAIEIGVDSTVNKGIGSWDNITFRPSFGDRVLATDTLTAIQVFEPRNMIYIYDMGQNFAGVPYIEFPKLKSGQQVNLKYSEMLYPDMPQYEQNAGMIMTENLRAAMNKDRYIASGEGKDIFSPRMTLHGYRYVEITGLDEPLPLENVKGLSLSSVHKIKAHYECSDTLVNRLWENIIWSTKSNFISIPTDCPQRNERLGWMGDISVFAPTATKLADVSPLLRQYLTSVRDCQLPNGKYPDVAPSATGFGGLLWGSAGIIVPWEIYLQYKDLETLREHYPSMKKYIDYIIKETIDPTTGIIVQNNDWGDLGDWLSPEYDKTDKSLLWECYFIHDLKIMREIANLLNIEDDAIYFDDLMKSRIDFFNDTYVDKETEKTIWSFFNPNNKGKKIDTQVSYALPIAFEIYSTPKFQENFKATIERVNTDDNGNRLPPYSLMTGFIGTAWISEALSKVGESDMAYKLLTNTNYPSWLYPVTQGATTIWERLNSYTDKDGFGNNNNMNSFNHYSFGSIGNWMLTHSLGINEKADGEIEIAPQPDYSGNITWANGWMETGQGRIESGWNIEADRIIIEVNLPEKREYSMDKEREPIEEKYGLAEKESSSNYIRSYLLFKEQRQPLSPGLNKFEFPLK